MKSHVNREKAKWGVVEKYHFLRCKGHMQTKETEICDRPLEFECFLILRRYGFQQLKRWFLRNREEATDAFCTPIKPPPVLFCISRMRRNILFICSLARQCLFWSILFLWISLLTPRTPVYPALISFHDCFHATPRSYMPLFNSNKLVFFLAGFSLKETWPDRENNLIIQFDLSPAGFVRYESHSLHTNPCLIYG
jgi:hypothetical protein